MSRPVRTSFASMRRGVTQSMLCGVLSFWIASGSGVFLALIGVGILVAWLICPASGRVAPRRAINAGLFGVVGLGMLQILRIGFTVDAFAFFIGLLMVVKVLDLRRPSDWGQVLTLSAALVVAGVLTSNGLMMGIALLVSAFVLARAVLRYQIYAAAYRGGVDTDAALPQHLTRALRNTEMVLCTAIFLAGTLVFLFLPRELGTEAFGRWGGAPIGQQTGYSDEVTLGQPGLVSESPTPVMDITMLDRAGVNIGSLEQPPVYLRGAVLERYDGGRWKRGQIASQLGQLGADFFTPGSTIRPWYSQDGSDWDTELRVTIRAARPGMTPAFTVWEPIELIPAGVGRFVTYNTTLGTVEIDQARGRVEYRIRYADPALRAPVYRDGVERARLPQDPIPPGVASYALDVLARQSINPDPATRPIREDVLAVRALTNHLKNAFTYTLEDQPIPPGRDATEWFLNDRRTGHCEYFASALAMMCRSVGINARVVTGYVMTDYNEVTRQYTVRESSAHAWIEAELAPGQWRTFDATPSAEFHAIHQPEPSFTRSVMNLFETIEYAWVNGVVAYNSESRAAVFGPLSSDFGALRQAGRMIGRLHYGGRGLVIKAVGAALVAFCFSMMIGLLIRHRTGWITEVIASLRGLLGDLRHRLGLTRAPLSERVRGRMLRVLDRAGLPKPAHRPMRAHLVESGLSQSPVIGEALRDACDLLYADRFGGITHTREQWKQAMRGLIASEKSLRRVRDRIG